MLRYDHDAPLSELEPGSLAHDVLSGIKHTADRERALIFSTAARVLRAYGSETALRGLRGGELRPGYILRLDRHRLHRCLRARTAANRTPGRRTAVRGP